MAGIQKNAVSNPHLIETSNELFTDTNYQDASAQVSQPKASLAQVLSSRDDQVQEPKDELQESITAP